MAAAVDDIASRLSDAGVGTLGTSLFRMELQPTPDVQVAVIPYGGMAPEGGFGTDGIRYEHGRLRISCRAARGNPRAAYAKAESVIAALSVEAVTIASTFYHRIWPLQSIPTSEGTDANMRPIFGVNIGYERDLGA